jgi:hypothetical protein
VGPRFWWTAPGPSKRRVARRLDGDLPSKQHRRPTRRSGEADVEDDIAALIEALPERVNADPALQRLGRFCSMEFLLEAGALSFHLVVERGRLARVIRGPRRMRGWAFALRAPEDAWRRFWQRVPDVGYNDIFAMSRYGHLAIEGDIGPLLAHLRYVKEVLALPRRMLAERAA